MPTKLAAAVSSDRPTVSAEEWQARVDLAACYRIFAMLGWTEMIYNHITWRLPDEPGREAKTFLINPFGLHYSEVTASNLVKIDSKGQVLDHSRYSVNPAGFTVHSDSQRHRRRPLRDAHAHHRRGCGRLP
jgi:ribulose-5-phosphate 4-epimerase/fuculose-1-phosphate aldolase